MLLFEHMEIIIGINFQRNRKGFTQVAYVQAYALYSDYSMFGVNLFTFC
jgi:hypothetical protein